MPRHSSTACSSRLWKCCQTTYICLSHLTRLDVWQKWSTVSKVPAAEYFVRISASGVQDADFVESFLLRWHRRSCFRIDGQKIYREPKGKIVRSPVPDKATNRSLAGTTVQGLSRGMLSKAVQDASWASFLAKLAYKAEEAGRQLVKVDPRGTSQRCPCGARVPKKLS